jgi:outer membrane lipoprotein carrier protein
LVAGLELVLAGSAASGGPVEGSEAALLERVRTTTAALHNLTATFEQRNDWELMPPDAPYVGKLFAAVDGRLRIEYEEPAGHLLVSDGARVWTYIPETGQVIESRVAEGAETAARLFLDFLAGRRVAELRWHGETAELALEPEAPGVLKRLVVEVETRSGLGRRFAWTDREGNTATYRFLTVETNVDLDPSLFVFEPPDGVEVVRIDDRSVR